MEDFNSKYTGEEVEELLDQVATGGVDIDLSEYPKKDELSEVATSGSYNDLTDKPSMKTVNGESIIGEGNLEIQGDGEIMLSGKINLTSINEIRSAQNDLSKTNEIAFYLVTDRTGNIPSTQSCYNIPSDAVRQLSLTSPNTAINTALNLLSVNMQPIGVNVGDLIALTRVKVKVSDLIASIGVNIGLSGEIEIYQYKILSMNDAKPTGHNEANAGVMGLMSPWDKAEVNKISGIDNRITDTRNWLSSVNDTVERNLHRTRYGYGSVSDNMLTTGICAYTQDRIATIIANWTIFVDCSSDPDGGGYYHLKQTAVCRDGENVGKMWTRLGWYKGEGEDLNFLDWQKIGGGSPLSDGGFDWHFDIDVESGKLDVNEDGLKSQLGECYLVKNLGEENVETIGNYLSISFGDAYVAYTTDYAFYVHKDGESSEWKVEKYPTYSERFATKEELFNKVDKPSRNLLINSNFDNGGIISNNSPWEYVALGGSSTLDSIILGHYNGYNVAQLQYLIYGQPVTLEVGKIYTLSCMYISDGTNNSYIDYNNLLGEKNVINSSNVRIDASGIRLNSCTTYTKAYVTFSVSQTSESILAIGNTDVSGHGGLFISCIQLEEGNIPTEYRRAEDYYVISSNLKTINGESLIGTGNITISGGTGSSITEDTISDWGFTKNAGTITQIKANGTSIATSGIANIPAASTSAYGVTKLSSSTSSTSTTLAATASAVKSAYDLANGKQEKLTSGTNIKTINGQSILGSGNITISGGSSSNGGNGAYAEVNHGTSDTTFTLTSNTFHIWNEVSSLTLTLSEETAGVANEYTFQFTSGSTATTLTLPDNIKWSNEFNIEANKIYQISILNGLGSVLSWNNISKIKNVCTIVAYENWGMVEYAIRFEYPIITTIDYSIIDINDEIIETSYLDAGVQEMAISISDLNNVKTVVLNPSSDDVYIYVYET